MSTHDGLLPLNALEEHLGRWVAEGLITDAQAKSISLEERGAAPVGGSLRRSALVTESLGYVGGVLVVVASMLLTAQFWSDLGFGLRVVLAAAGAGLLVGVGAALPARPGSAGERLRSVAWLLSTGALAFLLGLVASEGFDWSDTATALLVAAGAAVYGAALWVRSGTLVQQGAFFVALAATAGLTIARLAPEGETGDALPGLGVLAVGAVWLALGHRELLAPRRFALVLGGIGCLLGASITQATDWGKVLALVTVLGLIALAIRLGEIALLAVGAIGMFLVFPTVVQDWFPGAVAAPIGLLLAGALLVLAALRSMRRDEVPPQAVTDGTGPRWR